MFKIERLEGKDLFSFKDVAYQINGGRATLIKGENRDNDSQKSNGSGKSSLIELVAIAITGTSLRKVKLDEIINDFADEGMLRVYLENDILEEKLVITRRFFRKSSSIVDIKIFKNGVEIEDPLLKDKSSVDEYNKYILERVGLIKDEIFNYFVLSKHRFTSFLNLSDTKKKEAINQFSKANAVDQAIEALKKDAEPISKEVDAANESVMKFDAQIEALQFQIEKAKESAVEREAAKVRKIEEITSKRGEIRKLIRDNVAECKSISSSANDKLDLVDLIDEEFDKCGDLSPNEQIELLIKLITDNGVEYDQDFIDELKAIESSADKFDDEIKSYSNKISELKAKIKELNIEVDVIGELDLESHENACLVMADEIKSTKEAIGDLDSNLQTIQTDCDNLSRKKAALDTKLAGKVTCPRCEFEFLVADEGFDVVKGVEESESIVGEIEKLSSESDEISLKADKLNDVLFRKSNDLKVKNNRFNTKIEELDDLQSSIKSVGSKIPLLETKIATSEELIKQIDDKIDKFIEDSFNEVMDHIEGEVDKLKDKVKNIELKNKSLSIDVQSLDEKEKVLNDSEGESSNNLQESIDDIKKKKRTKSKELQRKTDELNKYLQQEQDFIAFKAHLANTKIKDLNDTTNDFLEAIGSDLRIEISGFTKTKKGYKDKISTKLLRDGIDAGSFGKFSGGEQARITLACILAMSKLINMNCDDGKGLDLLVLDEVLDATDESGLMCILEALNENGITCLAVSHGMIAESYPYVHTAIKEGGETTIETNNY